MENLFNVIILSPLSVFYIFASGAMLSGVAIWAYATYRKIKEDEA